MYLVSFAARSMVKCLDVPNQVKDRVFCQGRINISEDGNNASVTVLITLMHSQSKYESFETVR